MSGKRRVFLSVSVLCASVFVCVSVFVAAVATAQIPQKISYQLRITDLAGEPLPGPHTVTYRIFDAPTDGTQLWQETQNETANDNGVVSTILGAVNPINIPFDGPCWLEVVVDGETLDPRRELVSSPYAFHATNTDNLGGAPPTAYSLDGHEHDAAYVNEAQANAINSAMIQDGQVTNPDLANNSVTTSKIQSDAVRQPDVWGGYVDLVSSQTVRGVKEFMRKVWVEQPDDYAAIAAWTNENCCSIYAENSVSDSYYTTGVGAVVPLVTDWGLSTDGRARADGGFHTKLMSTRGPIVMTTPMVSEMEVYLSGSGRLINGEARISLDPDIASGVARSAPMKIIVTPAGMCKGLAVMERDVAGFTVRELANGTSNAAFDWLVIARQAASPGSRAAAEMPEVLPEIRPGVAYERNPEE